MRFPSELEVQVENRNLLVLKDCLHHVVLEQRRKNRAKFC